VNEIVEDVLRIARSDLIGRGVTVHTALAESVPQVLGDRIQLQQVLLNLILNASDAMAANPPAQRHLTIATAHHDGWVRVSVSDNGCGLPPEAERIFQPFYSTKKEGLGLGLPICRSIATAHQGRLWAEPNAAAESSPAPTHTARGTTLHLELTAAEAQP
jgi:C4-dicarboxylate-specific signal transduction histidine kinase